jgi:hypothetical protein
MKQHISAEDLQELTQEQKDRLREWWKPEIGDMYVDEDGDIDSVYLADWNLYMVFQDIQKDTILRLSPSAR